MVIKNLQTDAGFDCVLEIHKLLSKQKYESKLLRNMLLSFPQEEISSMLVFFREIFDEKQAKRDGFIRPLVGVDEEYDAAKALVTDIEKSFDEYLLEQKRETGIRDLSYFGSNKDRYQIEVPMSQIQKVPKCWTSKSQKKTHRRFWSPFIEENLNRLTESEDRYTDMEVNLLRCFPTPTNIRVCVFVGWQAVRRMQCEGCSKDLMKKDMCGVRACATQQCWML